VFTPHLVFKSEYHSFHAAFTHLEQVSIKRMLNHFGAVTFTGAPLGSIEGKMRILTKWISPRHFV